MPTILVDFLLFWSLVLFLVVLSIMYPITYFGITRRLMGRWGKAEFRNKSGIIGAICPPDGNPAIERLKIHYTGLLYSIAKTPAYGRIFFSGKDTLIRPLGASRLAVIEARSGLVGRPDLAGLAEVLSGKYHFRGKNVNKNPPPRADSIEQLIMNWAETKYYPSLTFQPRVRSLNEKERAQYEKENPTAYIQWKETFLADQRDSAAFEVQRINELSVLKEIKTGVLRNVITIERFVIDNTKLTVSPITKTIVGVKKLRDDEIHEWYTKMVGLAAEWPESWPVEIGGREVDIREIFKWNLSTFDKGDITALDAVNRDLAKLDTGRDFVRIASYGVFFMLFFLGVAILLNQLGVH